MRVGLSIMRFNDPNLRTYLTDLGQVAEETGFYSLWVMDHFFQIPIAGAAEDPLLEAYSTLGFLAGVTEHAKLGALVSGVMYRNPGLLIKQATTVDVLSGGRAYFGIGASWYEREAAGLGFPFPSLAERFERLEETLQIAHQLWSTDLRPYQGRYYQMAEPIISPKPISQPYPPILVGGQGEKKTLRLVAQYADACNLMMPAGIEAVQRKLDVLRRYCDEIGRDYATIEKTALMHIDLAHGSEGIREAVAQAQSAAQLGIEHTILVLPEENTTVLKVLGREFIPRVAELSPAAAQ